MITSNPVTDLTDESRCHIDSSHQVLTVCFCFFFDYFHGILVEVNPRDDFREKRRNDMQLRSLALIEPGMSCLHGVPLRDTLIYRGH